MAAAYFVTGHGLETFIGGSCVSQSYQGSVCQIQYKVRCVEYSIQVTGHSLETFIGGTAGSQKSQEDGTGAASGPIQAALLCSFIERHECL